eukprot:TRINITY_DN605_c0_g1_i5.p1 TRINITY_DN605_c0_g1~~TRINITY_DN605_c0_g1_i5.p1  ORF type:complete len:193 (+),score=91.36 TRINITY_DN605_c0_g1_i5:407-985(+)
MKKRVQKLTMEMEEMKEELAKKDETCSVQVQEKVSLIVELEKKLNAMKKEVEEKTSKLKHAMKEMDIAKAAYEKKIEESETQKHVSLQEAKEELQELKEKKNRVEAKLESLGINAVSLEEVSPESHDVKITIVKVQELSTRLKERKASVSESAKRVLRLRQQLNSIPSSIMKDKLELTHEENGGEENTVQTQ